jgi:hypothetical protein
MSQRISATFTCPLCGAESEAEIFRTIWGEVPGNRELVFSDRINKLTCPRCNRTSSAGASLMYTHAELQFAVWYEPVYDSQIDVEMVKYAELFKQKGPAYSYLQAPPRVREWKEFKELIAKYERGEIVTDSQKFRASASRHPTSKGCLGVVVAIIAGISFAVCAVLFAGR